MSQTRNLKLLVRIYKKGVFSEISNIDMIYCILLMFTQIELLD